MLRLIGLAAVLLVALVAWRLYVSRPGTTESFCAPDGHCVLVVPHPTTATTRKAR